MEIRVFYDAVWSCTWYITLDGAVVASLYLVSEKLENISYGMRCSSSDLTPLGDSGTALTPNPSGEGFCDTGATGEGMGLSTWTGIGISALGLSLIMGSYAYERPSPPMKHWSLSNMSQGLKSSSGDVPKLYLRRNRRQRSGKKCKYNVLITKCVLKKE